MNETTTEQGKISPNFNHRITYTPDKELTRFDLIDGIEHAAGRAKAVLRVIKSLCTDERNEGNEPISRINPETVYFSLESVEHDIDDLLAIGVALRQDYAASQRNGDAA